MGKILDISSKLTNEPVFLHLGDGKDYKVDDSKNTVFKIMEMWDNDDVSEMKKLEKTVEIALGNKAYKEIEAMKLSMPNFRTVAMAVMATISGQSFEEFEARFHDETK